jgi:hypothetical protein
MTIGQSNKLEPWTTTTGTKMARPKAIIDKKVFEQMCGVMCTQEEIASFFRCSEDTISRWCQKTYKAGFAEIYKTLSVPAKRSLRSRLFQMAIGDETKDIKPNLGALIWLSKQYLGMTEKVEDTTPLENKATTVVFKTSWGGNKESKDDKAS